jgi:hypothetical protein
VTAPESCGRAREHAIVPQSCTEECTWPDCLSDHQLLNLRLMTDGQFKTLREKP